MSAIESHCHSVNYYLKIFLFYDIFYNCQYIILTSDRSFIHFLINQPSGYYPICLHCLPAHRLAYSPPWSQQKGGRVTCEGKKSGLEETLVPMVRLGETTPSE